MAKIMCAQPWSSLVALFHFKTSYISPALSRAALLSNVDTSTTDGQENSKLLLYACLVPYGNPKALMSPNHHI